MILVIMDGYTYVRRLGTVLLPSEASNAMMKGIDSPSSPKYYDTTGSGEIKSRSVMDVLKISVSLAWDVTVSAGRMHIFQVHRKLTISID